VEAQFAARNITSDQTKYNHLVGSLSTEIALDVRDQLINPPTTNKYSALKEAIISQTAKSRESKIRQLLNAIQLEDRKPSQLLKRMRQLRGNNSITVPDELLKHMFLQRLPLTARIAITTAQEQNLDRMAKIADEIMDITPASVAAVETPKQKDDVQAELEELRKRVYQRQPTANRRMRGHELKNTSVYAYIDDLLIASATEETHAQDLGRVLIL
jgi:hypothetical protein